MKRRQTAAGSAALSTIALGLSLAAARPAGGQMWIVNFDPVQRSSRSTRAYYRAAATVPLGRLVDQTGTNTRAHWQSRLNRDTQRIGVAPQINPRDRDDDGVDDPFDRWPNDPARW